MRDRLHEERTAGTAAPSESAAKRGSGSGALGAGGGAAPRREGAGAELLDELWPRLQAAILRRIQPEQFETWFSRAALTLLDGDEICITVQNSFSRDWLKTYYADVIAAAAQELLGTCPRLEIAVDPELAVEAGPPVEGADHAADPPPPARAASPPTGRARASCAAATSA